MNDYAHEKCNTKFYLHISIGKQSGQRFDLIIYFYFICHIQQKLFGAHDKVSNVKHKFVMYILNGDSLYI